MQIMEFRKGDYEEKEEHVKKAWLFCMMELMNYVNTAWARVGVKRTKKLWERTTTSDEALVSWYLLCYVREWTKEVEEEDAHNLNCPEKKLPKRVKRRTEHYSRSKLYHFFALEKEIHSLRGTSRGWDDAITDEAERLYRKKVPASTTGAVNREKKKPEEASDLPNLRGSEMRFRFTDYAVV